MTSDMQLQNSQDDSLRGETIPPTTRATAGKSAGFTQAASHRDLAAARTIVASARHSHLRTMKAAAGWLLIPSAVLAVYAVICGLLESWNIYHGWQDGFIEHVVPLLVGTLFWTILPPIGLSLISIRRSARARHAIEVVRGARRVSDAGLLIEAIQIEYDPVRKTAADALRDILPRMTEGDCDLLTVDQRRYLVRLLHMNPEMFLYKDAVAVFGPASLDKPANKRAINLRVAILKAYREIGGALELPIVRRLAALPHANTPARRMLTEAAQEALPFVVARVERLAKGDTLLRPSEGEQASLLRTAHLADETPADQLLRPRL
jgi:hypothetical protein